MGMLSVFIMLQAITAIVGINPYPRPVHVRGESYDANIVFFVLVLALAIALHQDFNSWPTDVALLFAASLLGLVITFPSHFLTSSEDFMKSKRKNLYFLLAGKDPGSSCRTKFGWAGIVLVYFVVED